MAQTVPEWESCDPGKVTSRCLSSAVNGMRVWSGQGGAGRTRTEAWHTWTQGVTGIPIAMQREYAGFGLTSQRQHMANVVLVSLMNT